MSAVTEIAVTESAPVAELSETTAAEGGVAASLGLNAQLFGWQLLNFAVVALIVWFLILKPLAKKMEERRKIIDDSLDQAREIETRHALSREQYQTAVAEAKAEANRIVASAHDEAAALAGQMKGETKKEIDVLVSQAKKNIELDRQNMQQEVKKEIVDVVIAAVEKILEEKLDEKEDRKLVEGALKSIK
ncbi:MAG: ATP synthase subunit b [Candidatus Magasanikbacteria bacterium GW2011_GWA2_56_11]|uniref:ATP synthase subunit b n=1 Tax=Candidatus Magasanikbacteria bacterium GW2011_GWA2_56_11 TaxID=1619044 RepID=A0A0G1YGY5_9BACT|nr:MAG: ATP synthase subunit b [Candidatus Magasanikbacteria bacterium GW2011_GWA2_56_11]